MISCRLATHFWIIRQSVILDPPQVLPAFPSSTQVTPQVVGQIRSPVPSRGVTANWLGFDRAFASALPVLAGQAARSISAAETFSVVKER